MVYCNDLFSSSPASVGLPWKNDGRLLIALCALVLLWGGAVPTTQAQPTVTDFRPESGTPNTQVRIYGSGFSTSGNNVVNIGGTTATIDSAKTTVLYVRVPSSVAGPAQVEVSSDGGSTFVTVPERLSVVRSGTGDFVPDSVLTPAEGGEVARGDVDGDGDIDLLVTGRDGGGSPITQLYVNDGSGSFTAVSDGLPDLKQGTADFGDVDNDGDLDVLLTGVNASSTRVTRLFTKDDGSLSYTASGITFPGFQNGGTALGDVEGDGDLDIVLAGNSGGSATASLYTNQYVENGSLGFAEETGVSFLGTTSSTVDLGDFNGDGDLDVVITGQDGGGSATTTLYTNDGGGTSFTATSLSQAVQNGAVAVGDVDNNQTLDLVVSGNTGSFGSNATTLLFNDGTGSFTADQSLAGLKNGTATFGDVNADGNLDLLVTGQQGSDGIPVSILYRGDGTSSSPFSSLSTSSLSSASVVDVTNSAAALVDIDGDGRLTPFLAGAASTGLTATLHRPVLSPVSSTPPPNAQSVSPTSLIDLTFNAPVADLTGLADSIAVRGTQSGAFAEADGAVSGTGTNTLTYDPNGNFAPGEQVSVRLRPGIESTGGLSMFVPRGFRFRAAASAGPATFPVSETVSSSETEAREVATGFLTGDGTLDLVVTATGDDEVTLYPGNGDGTFASGTVIASGLVYARALALADVTGDGLLDVVVGEGAQGTNTGSGDAVRFYENQGSGSFGSSQTVAGSSVIDDVRDLAVADFDGNGTQDIVAVSANNSRVNVHLNDGGGASFTTVSVNQSADDPRAVTVTDVDFNGTPDLVVGSVSDDDISWYPNQGDGTFGSEKSIDGGAVNPRSVQTADFDQDGRPEVLSAERGDDGTAGDGRVAVHDPTLFNDSFTWNKKAVATTDSVLTAVPADVNADGLVDVVAGSVGGDSLVWYENTGGSGTLSFASGKALDTGRHNVQDVIAGDFDGDGSLDPALASADQNTVAFYPNIAIGPTIYVDKTNSGAQYGTSWNKAFTSLQDALGVAEAGDEIRIAEGTYYPDNGTGITAGKRDTSFVVTGALDPLTIKGGYPTGGGTRDVSSNTVTFSGDVDASSDLTGNSYHVLFFDGTNSAITTNTRLDGVTVTGGYANGTGDNNKGGGLFCDGYGGTCSPVLDAVTFSNNAAPGGKGGALFNDGGSGGTSSPVITNALFSDNSAGSGGAMHNSGGISGGTSSPDITDSVFENNTAGSNGGGAIRNNPSDGVASPTITQTTFEQNSTSSDGPGGAIKNEVGSNPTITKSIFRQNVADGDGGAIYNEGDGDTTHPVIISSVFVENEALASGLGSGGGALFNDGSSGKSIPQIINAVFVNNDATNGNGGAILNDVADPELINSTFTGNVAFDQGGAMKNYGADSNPTITNTILWDNTADGGSGNALYNTSGDNVSLNFTIVDDADIAGGTITASDTLQRDPQFAGASTFTGSDNTPGTADDSLVVLDSSPAVDAGDNTALDTTGNGTRDITTDITGGTRVVDDGGGATVNLGAYEVVETTADNTAPTISNAVVLDRDGDGKLDAVNVTYSEEIDDTTVDASDYALGGTPFEDVAPGFGTSSEVQLQITTDANEVPGTDPAELTYTPGTTADPAGNTLAEVTASDVTEGDGAAPIATQITRSSPTTDSTNSSSVTFAVTFSESVESVDDADFIFGSTPSGGATLDAFGPTSGSTISVSVSSIGGDGTLGLNVADTDNDVTDSSGNPLDDSEPTTDETYTIDNTAPSITAITRFSPSTDSTNNSSVTFKVAFSETVVNVGTDDFALSGTAPGGDTLIDNVDLSGSDTTVTVTGLLSDGDVGLSPSGNDIQDPAGNTLDIVEVSPNETYLIDQTAPTISNVSLGVNASDELTFSFESDQQLDLGNGAVQVTVDGPNSGTDWATFTDADFSESGNGPYTYTLTTTQAYSDGDGSYTAVVDAAVDPAGNNGASGESDAHPFDGTPPTVTAITRTSPTPTNNASVTFKVDFSEQVSNLGTTDFALTNQPGGTATINGLNTSGDTTVTVGSISGDGPLGLNVADGDNDVTDSSGNLLDDSEPPTDETYTIDNTAPSISGVAIGTALPPADTIRIDTGDQIALRFTSNEPLDLGSGAVQVTVGGPSSGTDWKTFTDVNFSESSSGPYTYTLSTTTSFSDGPGEYKAVVDLAEDRAGNDGAGGQSDAVLGLAVTVQAGTATRGNPVDLTVSVDDGGADAFSLTDAALQARRGGANTYTQQDQKSGTFTAFTGTIDDTLVTTRGVDYYATLTSSTKTFTVPAGGVSAAQARPAHLPVSFEELSPPPSVKQTLFQEETYRMVSVPAIPRGGLKAAFERSDAYGPYDANEWRLERWNANSSGYDSYPAIDSLQAGDGFWLTTRRGLPFTIPEGRTVKADTTAEIPLTEGWNQVGTPFGFAVPWDTIRAASGFSTGDIDGPVGYDDGGFVPGQDSLNPWKGYFLYNATGGPDTLKVPPVGRTGSSASQALTAKSQSAKRPEAQLAAADAGSAAKAASGRYTLNVRALSKDGTAEATLGLWPEAKVGRGPYDHAQPPSVTGGLRLSALETVNGTAVPHSHSIKPKVGGSSDSEGGRSWTLRLHALEGSGTQRAKLRLQGTGSLPSGHARYVLDLTNKRRLTPGAELSIEGGETRRLKVLLGTKAYAKDNSEGISLKSLETTLRANYPNPFDDKTTVEYVVAEEQTVTIEIYNVLGQRVETLVDSRKAPGVHRETWDGTNRYGNRVGSGVFFLRLRAGDVTETQKAVLVR